MSARSTPAPTPALSALSLNKQAAFNQANPIDLTDDDNDDNDSYSPRSAKRIRRDSSSSGFPTSSTSSFASSQPSSFTSYNQKPAMAMPYAPTNSFTAAQAYPTPPNQIYRPPFAGPSHSNAFFPTRQQTLPQGYGAIPPRMAQELTRRQVIDLTGSPSPPPPIIQSGLMPLPDDLSPKTPVCIGQLAVTALVLYPVTYLQPQESHTGEGEWAPVKLQYEHSPTKGAEAETINIITPGGRSSTTGETSDGETFGVVEQKVSTSLGPMLGKGLIRLDAKVRKGLPNLPILPLQMLVYTPKGNIPVVGKYLGQCGLFLEHPSPPYDAPRIANYHYWNPHNPAGTYGRTFPQPVNRYPMVNPQQNRWTTPTVAAKSVEIQRSQVDELFKSLKSGDELEETDAPPDVATTLYGHQKKALTFLLERERERPGADGKFSSLWQPRVNPVTQQVTWYHVVTAKTINHDPKEGKGSILADDMGLGKTITCVSLIAATLKSARDFAASGPDAPVPGDSDSDNPDASHFSGRVWGMPEVIEPTSGSAKAKAKAQRMQDKADGVYARQCRIKTKSRGTLILCPLSTVANWEEQFREHWKGEVQVVGGSGISCTAAVTSSSQDMKVDEPARIRSGTPIRVYVYHGNARRPDPTFLADFDAVITTYATLASEFSKQARSVANADAEDEDDASSDGMQEYDENGNMVVKLAKPKKNGLKRKLPSGNQVEATSALQSVHWFRVVLDEAHCIKETGTVGSRASCDLMADRRLCLTGTPVQNKLDDIFALIKFLRLTPFDEKVTWTEFIGTPVKFGQALGVARLQTIMKCITLRRTKESKTQDGKRILNLPPRRDELRYLKFDEQEQGIYNQFFNESKAEFNDLSDKNEVMKNYVGILQKILRLRQICDHYELVEGKELNGDPQAHAAYEDIVAAVAKEGLNPSRASAIFALLRESATAQCVECGCELCNGSEAVQDSEEATTKRPKKGKGGSRAPTRASSPSVPRAVLTRCQHLFCVGCYRNSVCPGWPEVANDVWRQCSACQMGLCPTDAIEIKPEAETSKKKPQKREKRQKGMSLDNFHPSTKVKALLGDLIQFSKSNPHSGNYDPSSIEIQMVDGQGNDIDEGAIKTVVFSQWTSMLDKIEDALEAAGIRYDRLDGTMRRDERSRAMDNLKHDPACEVLLVSLKAGGVGLNLTAAQRVYLMDPYWNPAVENQAVDRIHRLGQTRPVTTVKLIIENSIEARLLEVQKKKADLANLTLGGNFSKAEMMARRMEELNQLFE